MELNRIYNMDCFDGMQALEDKSIDYAFTSPPYNRKRNDKYEFYNDTLEDYNWFLIKTTEELLRICRKHIFINVQTNFYNKADVYQYIGTYHALIQNIIVWEKSNPMPCPGFQITNAYEYFICIGKKPLRGLHTYTKNHITTAVNSRTTMKKIRAVMNIDVADWMFRSFIPEGSTIIDPFMGTGTTAVAALKHKCQYIGYEIVPEYCRIAEERIAAIKQGVF